MKDDFDESVFIIVRLLCATAWLEKMLERSAKSRAFANAAGEGADVALSMNVVVWKGAIAGGTITAY
ncbi:MULTISPECIES: hypothetical protein [unclassified Pseudomonas]|uniref:hypothetical protein n=1 Tax=Pseudomonas sp. NFACC24-1 TaxID=1566189 RepID=UPI000ACD5386|nr:MULTISPECIES: hypothetical protein [unclassified Pseudomonas]